MDNSARYTISAASVARSLAAVAAGLIVVHLIAMQVYFNDALDIAEGLGLDYWHVSIFDLDEEESFGTWFSSGILMAAGVLLLLRGRLARSEEGSWYRWWIVLGIGFVFLSLDEVVALHEYGNSMLEEATWTVFAAPLLALVGLAYVPFLRHYGGRTAVLFLLAGAIYGGGAVGVEHFTDADVNSLHYNMWTALEEGMEMFGVILFIYAILDHMGGRMTLAVTLPSGGEEGPPPA